MMSKFGFFSSIFVCFQFLVLSACSAGASGVADNGKPGSQPPLVAGTTLKRITDRGGRLAWYQGARHELIAFDTISDRKTQNTEVYIMRPDGTQRTCVTCSAAIPKGFVGQPAWHPAGGYILVQVENANSKHTRFNHVSFGFDNDLWIVKSDGSGAERIFVSPPNHAALHPHFNKDGTRIVFAERVPTGRSRLIWKKRTPGGENPWDGWQIHVADFDINQPGDRKLSNHRILFQGEGGFFETHGFTASGEIVYSHTAGGKPYVDDIYLTSVDGKSVKRLVNSPETWDEHGIFSPSGRVLAFNSSRGDPSWRAPRSKFNKLTLDLYLKSQTGEIKRLTDMNALMADQDKRYVTSDFDWDRTGQRIAFQVAPFSKRTGRSASPPQIWILTFSKPQ